MKFYTLLLAGILSMAPNAFAECGSCLTPQPTCTSCTAQPCNSCQQEYWTPPMPCATEMVNQACVTCPQAPCAMCGYSGIDTTDSMIN